MNQEFSWRFLASSETSSPPKSVSQETREQKISMSRFPDCIYVYQLAPIIRLHYDHRIRCQNRY